MREVDLRLQQRGILAFDEANDALLGLRCALQTLLGGLAQATSGAVPKQLVNVWFAALVR